MPIKWYGPQITRRVSRHVEQNLDMAATHIQAAIVRSFGDSGVTGTMSGATAKDRAGNRSAAWGPPNRDAGHLAGNIGVDRSRRMRRRVGTGIGNKATVGYANWLEFGTRHMLPRPFIRPPFWNDRTAIRRYLGRPMR